MLAEVLKPIEIKDGWLTVGDEVDIPETVVEFLGDKIRLLGQLSMPRIENGELRLLYPVENLPATIVDLTKGNLPLQKKLLLCHCQQYSPFTHFWNLKEKWQELAAILEYDAGMYREEAEIEAAKMYYLEAFMDELRA